MLRIRCLYSKFFQSTHSEELHRSLKTICSFLFTSKGTIEEVIRIFLNHLTSVGAWAVLHRLALRENGRLSFAVRNSFSLNLA